MTPPLGTLLEVSGSIFCSIYSGSGLLYFFEICARPTKTRTLPHSKDDFFICKGASKRTAGHLMTFRILWTLINFSSSSQKLISMHSLSSVQPCAFFEDSVLVASLPSSIYRTIRSRCLVQDEKSQLSSKEFPEAAVEFQDSFAHRESL